MTYSISQRFIWFIVVIALVYTVIVGRMMSSLVADLKNPLLTNPELAEEILQRNLFLMAIVFLIIVMTGYLADYYLRQRHVASNARQNNIKQALAFQRSLIEANTDFIFVKDAQFRIIEANKAFLELYPEDQRDQVLGTTTVEQYQPDQVEKFLAEDKRAFAEGSSEVVETIDFPNGSQRTFLTKKIRFENVDNEACILCVSRDITKLKNAETALAQANAELEEFAYRTSHDLRSPLISSIGLLDHIHQQLPDNSEIVPSVQLVKKSLINLEQLVSDILQLTKIKNFEEKPQPVDVNQLIIETIQKLDHMDHYKNLKINTELQFQGQLISQKDKIIHIIDNLLSNAIKYHDPDEPEPFITIKTDKQSAYCQIEVIDNGLGIPKHKQDDLFSMFHRFHPRVAYGSGLGLFMIKRSVKTLGGIIDYEDTGNGSLFRVKLPLKHP